MAKDILLVPGGVEAYIADCPPNAQTSLNKMRAIIVSVAPDAIETISYFNIPGYAYKGYDYNGMFAWFSYKEPFIRLHVRPPVLESHNVLLVAYSKTKSILNFPLTNELPANLIKELVKASIQVMKEAKK